LRLSLFSSSSPPTPKDPYPSLYLTFSSIEFSTSRGLSPRWGSTILLLWLLWSLFFLCHKYHSFSYKIFNLPLNPILLNLFVNYLADERHAGLTFGGSTFKILNKSTGGFLQCSLKFLKFIIQ